ncbi:MAG: NADH-quinone oxidoreductase subunit M [Phycisphaeraceae bacterium]
MTSALLLILLLIPLAGAAVIALGPKEKDDRVIALVTTLANFLLSILVIGQFDWSRSGEMQVTTTVTWVKAFGLSFSFGVDAISLWLLLLTTFLMPIIILGSFSAVKERIREFFVWLLILETAMIGTFVATDVLFFYICFEFTLVPLYFLIGIWGSTQRLRAAKIFFLYTFTGSMLTFAGVLFVAFFNAHLTPDVIAGIQGNAAATLQLATDKLPSEYAALGSWSFNIKTLTLAAQHMSLAQQSWVILAMLAGFAVKVPIFPVHTWLPLAHTEAPTAGSVILAGVLLKLGTYGILRLAIPMAPLAAVEYAPVIGTLAVIGILYAGLICWVQKDIKKLIAYSSVSHLGFCVLGLFAFGNVIGPSGSVAYMINHGLSTGALFLCVGMIYERFHTREMRQYGGMAKVMPIWGFFMVFFCMASVGLPGLNGFVGEFTTLMGTFTSTSVLGPWFAVPAGAGMIIGAIYILYMVGKVVLGPLKVPPVHHEPDADSHDDPHAASHGHHEAPKDLNAREIMTLVPLAVLCLLFGLFPNLILKTVETPVRMLTQSASRVVFERKLENEPVSPPYVAPPKETAARDENERMTHQAALAPSHLAERNDHAEVTP